MAEKTTLVIAAVVGAFAGTFLTRYMVSGHQDGGRAIARWFDNQSCNSCILESLLA